ncbi:Olfactory receptor 8K3 [Heterocephalus glaber]|uniref:Olfactory receptor 8K3 n=1 Tax=Heterocephalus glaber TaxID=10181 RepID=G5AJN0_HETGA|nr:Olfactory receptor 8K3 [Heterocephalus glaber]
MEGPNFTVVTEFILLGITDRPELQAPLFLLFLVIYLILLLGNLGMIILAQVDPRLQTPMYFFLRHLALTDLGYSTAVGPKMLGSFVVHPNTISYYCSAAVCLVLEGIPYLYCTFMSLAVTTKLFTLSFSFCGHNVISHFYCDWIPFLSLLCSNTHEIEWLIMAFAAFDLISSLLMVLVSYLLIPTAILRMKSAKSRYKAFSTCRSHLSMVTVFYGKLIFMYMQPKSSHSNNIDKMSSIFYTLIIPLLSPLTYSLRNKDVRCALQRTLRKICSICS